jgi:uncharacterized protein (DUF2062 family)
VNGSVSTFSKPLLFALRRGATPRRIAWSLALGMVVGINPTVGVATILVLFLAWAFGLSRLASFIGVHLVTPLHLLLFIPFIEISVHSGFFHSSTLTLFGPPGQP